MIPPTLLFGATSILGFSLANIFPNNLIPFISPGNRSHTVRQWPFLQLEQADWPKIIFRRFSPKLLIYCHAVCDVAKCQSDPVWAHTINVQQVQRTLEALPQTTRFIYVSSDHVFGGNGVYDETSSPCPITDYGETRVEAERIVLSHPHSLVIRMGLAIGPSPNGRTGHWDWLRYRTKHNLPITIVDDEYRSVYWVENVAARVMKLAQSTETGIRHVTVRRAVSRVALANYLLASMGEPATFRTESRHERSTPHLGQVELASVFSDGLSEPLPSVFDSRALAGERIPSLGQP